MPRSSKWALSLRSYTKTMYAPLPVFHTCHMPCPPHSWFDHPIIFGEETNMLWAQIVYQCNAQKSWNDTDPVLCWVWKILCETIRRCTVQGLLGLFSRRTITEMYSYYYGTPYGLCFSIGNWLCCVSLWGVGGMWTYISCTLDRITFWSS
jgi:hypothetical protein